MFKHPLWVPILVVATACGGGGGVKIDDFPDELAKAICARDVRCGFQPDEATCEASQIFAGNDVETTLGAVKAKTIDYSEDNAKKCLDTVRNDDCTFTGFHVPSPCDTLFVGTLTAGTACVIDEECANRGTCTATDANCDRTTACCPGTCADGPAVAAVGAPCGDTGGAGTICDDGLYCKDTGGATGTCTALVATEGAACDTFFDTCADPFYCNIQDFMTFTGKCATPAASGATCVAADLIPCTDTRDYCDATSTTCTRSVGVDAACSDTIACIGFASCSATTMKCVANPSAGQACDAANGPDCLGTLDCTNAVCTAPAPGTNCEP
jgi:hypothetical protein